MPTFVNVAFALICVIGIGVFDQFNGQGRSDGCGTRQNGHIELIVPIVLIFVLEVDDVLRLRKAVRIEDPDYVDGAHVLRLAHKCYRFALVRRVRVRCHLYLHLAATFFNYYIVYFLMIFLKCNKRRRE
jgi:hypothetical protein